MNTPNHPRKESLEQRKKLEEGVKSGIVTITGLVAFGRGEAFDYLIGEKTTNNAKKAITASAAMLLLSKKPVISVNGNVTALCAKETIELANELNAQIEVNIFYPPEKRRTLIAKHFEKLGKKILGEKPSKTIDGISSNRQLVDEKGIFQADTILVPLEDGDRTIALKKTGKKVIAIDLNPKSRTSKTADITIADNVIRAIPALTLELRKLRKQKKEKLEKIINSFDNKKNLLEALKIIKKNA
mgnify:CR=1 FL=1